MNQVTGAICVIVALVIGIVVGGAVTESRMSKAIEQECDRMEVEEEQVVVARRDSGIVWVEAAEYDRLNGR